MRIALVSYEYEPEIGGIGTYVKQTALALGRRGHQIHLVCPDYGNPDDGVPSSAQASEPIVHRFPGQRRLGSPPSVFHSAWRMRSILRSLGADWVVLMDLNAEVQIGLLGRVGLSLGATPMAAVFHGSELHHLRVGKVARWFGVPAIDRCDVLFANSQDTMERVARLSPPAWRAKTVHAGIGVSPEFLEWPPDRTVEAGLRERMGVPEDRTILLTVARLVARKGIDRSLEVIARLEPKMRASCCYVVAGTGALESELKRLAGRLGITDSVRFWGAVEAAELPRLYDLASVYLQLSRAVNGDVEGLGISYLEAGARRVPSVGFRHGGVPEAVESGVTGLLVEEDDVAAAKAALEQLLRDEALRTRMGEASRTRVEARFQWDRVAERIEESLTSALRAGTRPASER